MAAWPFASGRLLLDLDSGEYHGLSRIDSLIWGLIDGERGLAEIVAELQQRLGVMPAEREPEAPARRVEALRQRGLVVG